MSRRIPAPSPRGTNRAGMFLPADFFASSSGAAYDQSPTSKWGQVADFLSQHGVPPAVIGEFIGRCGAETAGVAEDDEDEEGEVDESIATPEERLHNHHLGEVVTEFQKFANEKLSGDDVSTFNNLVNKLLRVHGEGGAADDLPSFRNGMPKSAMDSVSQIGIGTDSFGHAFDRNPVRMAADGKPKSGAAKYAPGISRIRIGPG
jgi:hypothetical protein